MEKMSGMLPISPVWGTGIFIGCIALIGIAPFSLFMSEFLILKAAVDGGSIFVMLSFLVGIAVVFIGAFGHIIPIAWATPENRLTGPGQFN